MSLREIYYILSPNLRLLARKVYYFPIDFYATIVKKRSKYEPKKGDIYIGSGDFIKQGEHQVNLLKKYANLKEKDCVLDIGSGIGRTAVSLTKFLTKEGRYEGFDVVEKGVKWCNSRIKKDFSNFNFIYVPLNNDLYNSKEKKASEFKFPYPDKTFDVVFLFSVFTHMQIDEIEHYLSEIHRVLKSNGKCLSTFFLYNSNNESIVSNIEGFSFPIKKEGYRLMSDKVKSANIAINESQLDMMTAKNNLCKITVVEGSWKAKEQSLGVNIDDEYQDIVVLEKKS